LIQGLESGMVLSIHGVSPRRPSRHGRDSEDYRRFGPPLPRSGFVQPSVPVRSGPDGPPPDSLVAASLCQGCR
jgi:hypothetical protein